MSAINQIGYMPAYGPDSKLRFTKDYPLKISLSVDTVKFDSTADYKVLLQCEPPNLYIKFCGMVYENYQNFDLILSYDDRILKLPNAMEFIPTCSWISDSIQIEKQNQVSFLMSSKINGHAYRMRFMIKKRLERLERLKHFDIMWYRSPPLYPNKDDFFKNAKFNIACENQIMTNMFSEKLLDCFRTYTVPIYYGCMNIEKYFNPKGMILFNTIDEFNNIIDNLHPDMYDEMKPYLLENYELGKIYWEKNIYQRIEDLVDQKLQDRSASDQDIFTQLVMLD